MYHFIYKTKSPSGLYYVGRHSTKDINDGYMGSGKWVRSVKDKTRLTREIVEMCDTYEELLDAERRIIGECIEDPNNMNFNNEPCGFASGKLNPAHRREEIIRRSERAKKNNPMEDPSNRQKVSVANKGRFAGEMNPMYGKKHTTEARERISAAKRGSKYTAAGRLKLAESRKRDCRDGKRSPPTFKGRAHSNETKKAMSDNARNRPKKECPFCGKSAAPHTYKRWHGDNCKKKCQK